MDGAKEGIDEIAYLFLPLADIDEVLMMDRNIDGDDSAIGVDDQRFHYHQDAIFSVYALTDENGDIEESYLYDPCGKQTNLCYRSKW